MEGATQTARKPPIRKQRITFATKLQIIADSTNMSQSELAKKYNKPTSTIRSILKRTDYMIRNLADGQTSLEGKRFRSKSQPEMERRLLAWIDETRSSANPVELTGPVLKKKMRAIVHQMGNTTFKCSHGWVYAFKARYGIHFGKQMPGGSKSITDSEPENWNASVYKELLSKQFAEGDIYHADASALFWRMTPQNMPEFEGRADDDGRENRTEQLTFWIGANLNGTNKLPMLIVGGFQQSTCPRNPTAQLPIVRYRYDPNARITPTILGEWLTNLNEKMEETGRKIALILDERYRAFVGAAAFTGLKLIFAPSSSTPVDGGLAQYVKMNYRRFCLEAVGQEARPTLTEAVGNLARAWDNIGSDLVSNCFGAARAPLSIGYGHDDEVEKQFSTALNCYRTREEIPDSFDAQDYFNIDATLITDNNLDNLGMVESSAMTRTVMLESNVGEAKYSKNYEDALPTYQDAKAAMLTLRAFLITSDNYDEKFTSALNEIEEVCDLKCAK